jgi:hypothetical protein
MSKQHDCMACRETCQDFCACKCHQKMPTPNNPSERLEQLLLDVAGYVTQPVGIEEPLLSDDGTGRNEFIEYYKSQIISLIESLVPEEINVKEVALQKGR